MLIIAGHFEVDREVRDRVVSAQREQSVGARPAINGPSGLLGNGAVERAARAILGLCAKEVSRWPTLV